MARRKRISAELAALADDLKGKPPFSASAAALNAAGVLTGQDTPEAKPAGQGRQPLYDIPKSGHSDLVTLLALRERPPFDDEYVDTQTLALVFKMSMSYFEKLRVSGGGPPFVRIGASVRYPFADAKKWAAERFARSTSEPADAA